jgi:hypothetical protein
MFISVLLLLINFSPCPLIVMVGVTRAFADEIAVYRQSGDKGGGQGNAKGGLEG